jgi:hypothetical protein
MWLEWANCGHQSELPRSAELESDRASRSVGSFAPATLRFDGIRCALQAPTSAIRRALRKRPQIAEGGHPISMAHHLVSQRSLDAPRSLRQARPSRERRHPKPLEAVRAHQPRRTERQSKEDRGSMRLRPTRAPTFALRSTTSALSQGILRRGSEPATRS